MDRGGVTSTAYDQSMTTRITVSLPDHLVEAAKQAVARGETGSVSAFVAEALQARLPPMTWAELRAEWERDLGPATPEEIAWADSEIARTNAEWAAIRSAE
jgi:Arc/MetJ-type ribon-helix-helix transcriptional regulator